MSEPYDLQSYIRHVDTFGPECVVETAARDGLPDRDVAKLQAYTAHRERTQRWFVGTDGHQGGWWKDRPGSKPRPCEHCGLDLPVGSRTNRRFHRHCASAARRRRALDAYTARHGIKPP